MSKSHEYSFDVLRVIAMIMVIIIHVSNIYCRSFGLIDANSYLYSLIFNTISRVSVPIFFMISGALLFNRSFDKTKYINRIKKFIILIIFWDIIYLIWEYLYLGNTYSNLFKLLFEPYRAHLWFLYTIVTLYLVQPIIKLIFDKTNKYFKYILFILWFIFSTLSMYNYKIASTFTLFGYIGYFVIGHYLYSYVKNNDLKKLTIPMIIMSILSYIASVYLNYCASKRFNYFYNLFFAYRSPFIILNSFIIFIIIYNLFHDKKPNKLIILFSDLSLGVYLIHGIFLDITNKLFYYTEINSMFGIPMFTLLIFIFSIICTYILKKIKYLKVII